MVFYHVWRMVFFLGLGPFAVTIIACLFLKSKGFLVFINRHINMTWPAYPCFYRFLGLHQFFQYFLIYSANIPERHFGIPFVKSTRTRSIRLVWVSMGLIFGHFFPFLYLIFYRSKVDSPRLIFIVSWILIFHALDLYWNIIPGREIVPGTFVGFEARGVLGSHLLWGLFSLIGVGFLCLWAVVKSFTSNEAEIIPIRDPRILDSIHHHE